MAQHVISITIKTGTTQLKKQNHNFNSWINRQHGHVGHGCLRGAAQPTEHHMHNELIGQLTSGILPAIIVLLCSAMISMFVGYRFVAKRLTQRGMKKGDARAIGQASASLLFLLIAGIYFKFIILN